MKKKLLTIPFLICFTLLFPHSGRTNEYGGHHNRKKGEYHYHNDYFLNNKPTENKIYKYEHNNNYIKNSIDNDQENIDNQNNENNNYSPLDYWFNKKLSLFINFPIYESTPKTYYFKQFHRLEGRKMVK